MCCTSTHANPASTSPHQKASFLSDMPSSLLQQSLLARHQKRSEEVLQYLHRIVAWTGQTYSASCPFHSLRSCLQTRTAHESDAPPSIYIQHLGTLSDTMLLRESTPYLVLHPLKPANWDCFSLRSIPTSFQVSAFCLMIQRSVQVERGRAMRQSI